MIVAARIIMCIIHAVCRPTDMRFHEYYIPRYRVNPTKSTQQDLNFSQTMLKQRRQMRGIALQSMQDKKVKRTQIYIYYHYFKKKQCLLKKGRNVGRLI